ncbi:MAG: penicillin-binding protein [Ruminococcaceae bacterium]|nr:penicillin-binding protein [Oscillospiraceae bacterium]
MKTLFHRAWVLYLIALIFLCGVGILSYTFLTNADSWAMKRSNRHIFKSGNLVTAGTITDESGVVLAESSDGKRTYHKSKDIRTATLHIVGDAQGYIASGVQTSYNGVLTGYNLIDGVYGLKKYGKGSDIQLTVNAELCATAYNALGNNKGTVGVYNYKTGEIVCVVSKPSYDIQNKPTENINNDTKGVYDGVYLNRFFSGVYTPGSTFKVITSACAIDNIANIDSQTFKCTGEYSVDGNSVKCMSVHGSINFEQALNQSCNSAFARIAIELGSEKLNATTAQLGFGKRYKVGNVTLARSSFDLTGASDLEIGWAGVGQHKTRVNPCHMMMIIGAIANGGSSPQPYFIKSVTSPTGNRSETKSGVMLEQMINPATADKLADMLRSNVKNSYGDGKFPSLEMCGKTGTAEVSSEEGGAAPHAWFVGFSQKENFPYAIVVVVENGGGGSSVAIPVANKTMQKTAQLFAK